MDYQEMYSKIDSIGDALASDTEKFLNDFCVSIPDISIEYKGIIAKVDMMNPELNELIIEFMGALIKKCKELFGELS